MMFASALIHKREKILNIGAVEKMNVKEKEVCEVERTLLSNTLVSRNKQQSLQKGNIAHVSYKKQAFYI